MIKVKDFISAANWTQRALARDEYDLPFENWPYAPTACKWCLTGLILYCYRDDDAQVRILRKVKEFLESDPWKRPTAITRWNDTIGRTWEDVRTLAQELDF